MPIPSEIQKLWQEHCLAVFPKGYGDTQISGTDLPLLEVEIMGSIRMYMNSVELDARRLKSLRERLIDLNSALLFLNGEELHYFSRIRELANLILQEVRR